MLLTKKKLFIGGLIIVVVAAATVWLLVSRKPKQVSSAVTYSTDTPSEKRPEEEGYVWRGGPSEPKKLKIGSIEVDAFVQKVGVDQNKQIAVPTNIFLTGWFDQSQKPGERGLSIIDGHLDGRTTGSKAVFWRLGEMKKDQVVEVVFGNNSTRKFSVMTVETVPTQKAAAILFSQDPKVESQLNLITCTGTYDKSAKSYSERIIVTAKLIN